MLEKRSGVNITFFYWLKIGLLSTVVAGVIGIAGLLLLEPLMPDRCATVKFEMLHRDSGRRFDGKNAMLSARIAPAGEGAERVVFPNLQPGEYLQVQLVSPGGVEASIPAALPPAIKSRFDEITAAGECRFIGKLYSVGSGDYPCVMEVEQVEIPGRQ